MPLSILVLLHLGHFCKETPSVMAGNQLESQQICSVPQILLPGSHQEQPATRPGSLNPKF